MELNEIIRLIDAERVTAEAKTDKDINFAIACDLLSWVVGNARPNCAFITIQTGINIIAVASLIEIGCIIIVEGANIDENVVKRAEEEDIPVIRTKLTTFDVCGILYQNGVKAVRKDETVR